MAKAVSKRVTLEMIRKPEIMAAALRKIAQSGINNITMDDIGEEAGISKGGIAHYFSSKEDLILKAIQNYTSTNIKRIEDAMGKMDNMMERLISFGVVNFQETSEGKFGHSIMLNIMAMACHDEAYRAIYHEWAENGVAIITRVLEDEIQAGRLKLDDVKNTARMISALTHGLGIRSFLDRKAHSVEWVKENYRKTVTRILGIVD
jgi:AcrR family transcriptional regulator